MAMTHQQADATLTAAFKGASTPHLQLRVGSPGADGTANVAQLGAGDAVRKPIAFGAIANHVTNNERVILSDGDVAWTGAEIDASQEITHFSIWSALTGGTIKDVGAVTVPKTTGSDGVTVGSGDLEIAYSVFVKPA